MGRKSETSVEKRVEHVMALLRKEEPATQIVPRAAVSEQALYRWRDEFVAGGKAQLAGKGAEARAAKELSNLQREIETRERVIGQRLPSRTGHANPERAVCPIDGNELTLRDGRLLVRSCRIARPSMSSRARMPYPDPRRGQQRRRRKWKHPTWWPASALAPLSFSGRSAFSLLPGSPPRSVLPRSEWTAGRKCARPTAACSSRSARSACWRRTQRCSPSRGLHGWGPQAVVRFRSCGIALRDRALWQVWLSRA